MMLAKTWTDNINPFGYYITEKLDGFRATWDGKKFVSRSGNIFECPDWFVKEFPNESIDGELWAGRGGLEKVASAVKGKRERDWKGMLFGVFDAPDFDGLYEQRYDHSLILTKKSNFSFVIPKVRCEGRDHLISMLDEVVKQGGEGLVIRRPRSAYQKYCRSDFMLKVKKTIEDDAIVLAHKEVSRPGLMGKLRVIRKDGLIFDVGSGISDKMAVNPPPIGTRIVYSYKQVSASGKPRSASFVRIKCDMEL